MNAELALNFGAAIISWLRPDSTRPCQQPAATRLLIWTAGVMVVLMTASQFITQKQIMSKNISKAMKESPTYKQQQILCTSFPWCSFSPDSLSRSVS